MKKLLSLFTVALFVWFCTMPIAKAQLGGSGILSDLQVHGDLQLDAQFYRPDSLIGAPPVPERVLSNGFANFIFTTGKFSAGVRYESYAGPLQGFDPRFRGSGFPYRFLSYNDEKLQFTVGNFYEQFGSGLVLRTWEDRNLGFDNSLDGFRLRFKPIKGIYLKGAIGRQRSFWDKGPGLIRAFDAEVVVNELLPNLPLPGSITVGGSVVSRFQRDEDPTLVLPENVAASSFRLNFTNGSFNFNAEYASKINDPILTNNFTYNRGEAFLLTAGYSRGIVGISLSAKRVDNFDFRNDRNSVGNNLNINFLPALTRQHTYALAGTIYPYATQPLGEMAGQAEITINLPRGSTLGGKYGTSIVLNASAVNGIQKNAIANDSLRLGYTSPFFGIGNRKYFRDYNIEITRKFSPKLKASLTYLHLFYDIDINQGLSGRGFVNADIVVLDVTYKIKGNKTIRVEAQTLQTDRDLGSWAMGLIEYTIAPNYFLAIIDQYNYGNPIEEQQVHYITGAMGYRYNTTRLSLSFGRQRAGIVCVGGVCRNVPASNGVMLTATTSF